MKEIARREDNPGPLERLEDEETRLLDRLEPVGDPNDPGSWTNRAAPNEAVSANPLEQVSDAELEQMITVLRDQIAEQGAIEGQATQIGHQSGLVASD